MSGRVQEALTHRGFRVRNARDGARQLADKLDRCRARAGRRRGRRWGAVAAASRARGLLVTRRFAAAGARRSAATARAGFDMSGLRVIPPRAHVGRRETEHKHHGRPGAHPAHYSSGTTLPGARRNAPTQSELRTHKRLHPSAPAFRAPIRTRHGSGGPATPALPCAVRIGVLSFQHFHACQDPPEAGPPGWGIASNFRRERAAPRRECAGPLPG